MGLAAVLAVVALGAGACGGTSGGVYGGSTGGTAPTSRATGGPGETGATAAHLTTSQGLSVYLFAADTGDTSTCYGGCAAAWPPVPAGTALAATSGTVAASLLGTTMRTDGSEQLTYAGHPLYRYVADTEAGDTSGQGLNASGGLWWLVSAEGAAVTSGGSSGSPGSSSGSGGVRGY